MDLSKEEAIVLVQTHLGPDWHGLLPELVELTRITAGISNRMFKFRDLSQVSTDGRTVLIRLYGVGIVKASEPYKVLEETGEVLVFYKLGTLGLGPKLLAVFDGGRIEEYIPSRMLQKTDLEDKSLREAVARKLARIHSLELPIDKTPLDQILQIELKIKNFLWKEEKEKFLQRDIIVKTSSVNCNLIANFEFEREIKWMRDNEPSVGGRTVFALTDMNPQNCLIREQPDAYGEPVTLIDYEHGCMTARGVDLGNHFNHSAIEFTDTKVIDHPYPSESRRREYVENYLNEYAKNCGFILDSNGIDSVDHVLKEAEFYGMVFTVFLCSLVLELTKDDAVLSSDFATQVLEMVSIFLRQYNERKENFIAHWSNEFKKPASHQ